jgi:hypothetical protein
MLCDATLRDDMLTIVMLSVIMVRIVMLSVIIPSIADSRFTHYCAAEYPNAE